MYCRNFDLYVNGGTPYEKNVEVDPTISRRSEYELFTGTIKFCFCLLKVILTRLQHFFGLI
jgi:hypothetical protein